MKIISMILIVVLITSGCATSGKSVSSNIQEADKSVQSYQQTAQNTLPVPTKGFIPILPKMSDEMLRTVAEYNFQKGIEQERENRIIFWTAMGVALVLVCAAGGVGGYYIRAYQR